MEIPIWGRDPNSSYFGLEMTQIRAKKEPKVAKMSQNELKRAKKKPQLAKMSQNEPKYAKMSQNEPKWAKKESEWAKMGALGQDWAHLVISQAQKQLILAPRGNLENPVSYGILH